MTNQHQPRINAIATAVPQAQVHANYADWAAAQLGEERQRKLLRRMVERGGIAHRHSVLSPEEARLEPGTFYNSGHSPSTSDRMRRYADAAPGLALEAIGRLPELGDVTHMVVASCTGFIAPGIDQVIARKLGLAHHVERTLIGFMGCYAGVTALRSAAHIVRSDPSARVLVVAVELCTLHMQQTGDLERLLAMAQFADGAAAAIISATGEGLGLGDGLSATLEESSELITWTIGDTGFAMHLSGEVPARLADALSDSDLQQDLLEHGRGKAWAVHPGGRSVLDAVERGLDLAPNALDHSRGVLADNGNMSSATVLFVLERMMADRPPHGIALAFGPGLAMEGLRFGWTDAD
ncbi:type III polyketide synthase [Paraurantiacibacter namhicola]|uniref:Alpha-pyrone synthesis polyketide synthase-like Pks18 n=1 Tax=Paraurantiacibacter namhicola TaxID=645517 RepID=A0A1C7D8C2_9SPHN|nr:stilbene synthase [Paraurantiacibacter namhicola]ANU07708.1 Alpha-pyrone synthesis polyketide synthase-like Pks18 [Paraurantiacibacter namhicola]